MTRAACTLAHAHGNTLLAGVPPFPAHTTSGIELRRDSVRGLHRSRYEAVLIGGQVVEGITDKPLDVAGLSASGSK